MVHCYYAFDYSFLRVTRSRLYMTLQVLLPYTHYSLFQGAPSIKQVYKLNDMRHIITKDSHGDVAIYDVLSASLVEHLGQVSIEEEIKKRTQTVFVPGWFTVDLKIGVTHVI